MLILDASNYNQKLLICNMFLDKKRGAKFAPLFDNVTSQPND